MVNDDTNWARESLDESVIRVKPLPHLSVSKRVPIGTKSNPFSVGSESNPFSVGSESSDQLKSVSKSQPLIKRKLGAFCSRMAELSTDSSNQDSQIVSQQDNVSNVQHPRPTTSSVEARAKSHSSCSSSSTHSGSSGASGSRGSGAGYPRSVIFEEASLDTSSATFCSNPNDQNSNTNQSASDQQQSSQMAAKSSSQSSQVAGQLNGNHENVILKHSVSIKSSTGSIKADENSVLMKPSTGSIKTKGVKNKSGSGKSEKKSRHETGSSSGSSSLNVSTVSISRLGPSTTIDGQQQGQGHGHGQSHGQGQGHGHGQSHGQGHDISPKLVSTTTSVISSACSTTSTRKYSRSHQRRFHRRFPAVDPDEMLIDWFNCALIADILLQGYLYISDNYFAFYSNIFGYKTQLLIPISDVVSVSKEKTAKIFPNAVGICTEEAKYVFGSLISRESAYKLLYETWQSFDQLVNSIPPFDPRLDSLEDSFGGTLLSSRDHNSKHLLPVSGLLSVSGVHRRKKSPKKDIVPGDSDNPNVSNADDSMAGSTAGIRSSTDGSSEGSSRVDLDSTASAAGLLINPHGIDQSFNSAAGLLINPLGIDQSFNSNQTVLNRRNRLSSLFTSKIKSGYTLISTPRSWNGETFLLIGTVALVLLFLSTAFLMYRVRRVQSRLEDFSGINSFSNPGNFLESDESFQGGSFAQEVKRVSSKLQSKLKEVTQLRESLEGLLATIVELPSDLGY